MDVMIQYGVYMMWLMIQYNFEYQIQISNDIQK